VQNPGQPGAGQQASNQQGNAANNAFKLRNDIGKPNSNSNTTPGGSSSNPPRGGSNNPQPNAGGGGSEPVSPVRSRPGSLDSGLGSPVSPVDSPPGFPRPPGLPKIQPPNIPEPFGPLDNIGKSNQPPDPILHPMWGSPRDTPLVSVFRPYRFSELRLLEDTLRILNLFR